MLDQSLAPCDATAESKLTVLMPISDSRLEAARWLRAFWGDRVSWDQGERFAKWSGNYNPPFRAEVEEKSVLCRRACQVFGILTYSNDLTETARPPRRPGRSGVAEC